MSKLKLLINKVIMEEKKFLKEDMYDHHASKLKLGKLITYKVGKGSREGQLVISGAKSLIDLLKGSPLASIQALQKNGIQFDKAFVNFRNIDKSYMGTGSGKTWTYSLFGSDSEGNEVIYDKYEGGTAGGGQSWIFVNGKKQKVSDYLSKIKLQPIDSILKSEGITDFKSMTTAFNGLFISFGKEYDMPIDEANIVFEQVRRILPKLKNIIKSYGPEHYLTLTPLKFALGDQVYAVRISKYNSHATKSIKI